MSARLKGEILDEGRTLRHMITKYLAEEGYTQSARTFADETHVEAGLLAIGGSPPPPTDFQDNPEGLQRFRASSILACSRRC